MIFVLFVLYRDGELVELDVDGQLIDDPSSRDRIAHRDGGPQVVATKAEREHGARGAEYGRAADLTVARFLALASDQFAMNRLVYAADDEETEQMDPAPVLAVPGVTEGLLYSPRVASDPFR